MNINVSEIVSKLYEIILAYGTRLVFAIILLVVGLILIKHISKLFKKFLVRRKVNDTLIPFFYSMFNMLLKALLIVSVMSTIGLEMTSFAAILGAAGLAIGMALSGTLQNFAGGVIILLLKPFKVGDVIDAQGYIGKVHAIQIFTTILKTPDNKTILIPNGGLSTGSMVNYSTEELRRLDLTYSIAYGDSFEKAKDVLLSMINADSRIINEPAEPFIAISSLAANSVDIAVRVWLKASDYWDVLFMLNEKVYTTFPANGLHIPFPQMDVHVKQA